MRSNDFEKNFTAINKYRKSIGLSEIKRGKVKCLGAGCSRKFMSKDTSKIRLCEFCRVKS